MFAAALFVITLILRVTLNVARGGTHRLDSALFVGPTGEGKNEYLPSLAAFDYGPRFFLDRFAELVPSLPVHSAGHPPGLLLVMHYLGPRHVAEAGGVHASSSARLSAPLTYVLAKRLFDEDVARIAGVLAAFAPALLHFGATSADAVYLTLGLLAAIPLLCKRAAGSARWCWPSSRCSPGRCSAVAAWAAILSSPATACKPAFRFAAITGVDPARLPRAVRARHRLRPARHAARHEPRLRGRDRLAAPVRVLAVRLPHGVPADPRRADLLAGAARASRSARPRRSRSPP